MKKIRLLVAFALCVICQSNAMNNVYVYDPLGVFAESIVYREVSGIKECLKSNSISHKTLNIHDKYGRSCLHYAALIEDDELYELMVEVGANSNIVDCFGFSAEDYFKRKHK